MQATSTSSNVQVKVSLIIQIQVKINVKVSLIVIQRIINLITFHKCQTLEIVYVGENVEANNVLANNLFGNQEAIAPTNDVALRIKNAYLEKFTAKQKSRSLF